MADDEEEELLPCTWKQVKPKVLNEDGEEEDDGEEAPEGERDAEGIPMGTGVLTYPSGDKFEGTLAPGGKREGPGKYTFAKGKGSYEGTYKDNIKEGEGKFVYPDQSSYEGGWVADKRAGEGVYKYANGDVYKGGWEADVKSGLGSYFFKDSKSTFMGTWVNGLLEDGEWIQKDGTVFKGTFKGNKPVKGSYVFASTGNVATGAFDKGGGFIQTATA